MLSVISLAANSASLGSALTVGAVARASQSICGLRSASVRCVHWCRANSVQTVRALSSPPKSEAGAPSPSSPSGRDKQQMQANAPGTSAQTRVQKLVAKLRGPGGGDVHEDVYTLPNAMSLARLASAPWLGYLIVTEQYTPALALFAASAVTDMLDGYIARRFDMRSVLGTILDPMADKVLMTTLTVSLGYIGLIPVPLAGLIIGRDVGLVISSFVVRYKSLPPPVRPSHCDVAPRVPAHLRYLLFTYALSTAARDPLLALMGATMVAPVAAGVPALAASPIGAALAHSWAAWLKPGLHWTVAATTLWSGMSYAFSRDVVRYLHAHDQDQVSNQNAENPPAARSRPPATGADKASRNQQP